ncbi:MAG TPA: M20/M25/M40 family metallo-hydrolase [Methylomusa anaerophila]|uniref:Peptidase T n=1 Tax=Methylomusa anaerophila TaxID=1930071 RepID=A0A348AIB2_9FIRM|nr:M20/M25/M40 family metallo-hydrolase [Methylomusa anaerophila]BBB90810.1 peptidase T [Methylomusa anaerophila]HML90533.1 M20/M25/M40 family metallo-hydrolase [Methylomusa anaerophila]
MINRRRMLNDFTEMVKIKCSSGAEREIADLLKQRLAELGLAVSEDDAGKKIGGNAGNVFGYLRGNATSAPTVFLSAHMDCVDPCAGVEPVLKDGVIACAGDTVLGADDKAGVAAIMEAVRVIKEENIPHGDIQIVFTVAEEGGLSGSKNLEPSLLKADFGYALDSGGSPGEIITMAPGQNSIKILVYGKKAHAGVAPEEGVNAIVLAGKALAAVKYGRIDFETTANFGIIKGGIATNIVPDTVAIQAEARSRNLDKLQAQTEHMRKTFEEVARTNGGRAEVTVDKAYDPYVLEDSSPVVALAKDAAASIGLTPVVTASGGGSDANYFNNYGVPTAVLGVGMSKVHTTEEYIKEEDLYNSAAYVVAIIKTAAQMKKN